MSIFAYFVEYNGIFSGFMEFNGNFLQILWSIMGHSCRFYGLLADFMERGGIFCRFYGV